MRRPNSSRSLLLRMSIRAVSYTQLYCKDGDQVMKGQLMGKVTGDIRVLLSGERVALNYLQRMSGIATYTHSVAALLEGTKTKLLDTRKDVYKRQEETLMTFATN